MADYEQYNSTNNEYQFSKGPKSLYFARGDEDLLGVILNVPQTDVDDEWGGTERIAWEVTVDEIGKLQGYVYDPAGGGTNGLVNKMDQLVGTSGLFDLTVPSLTLGNIQINVATDRISIGSGAYLTSSVLQLGTYFTVTTTSNYTKLLHKNYTATGSYLFLSDYVIPQAILYAGATSLTLHETIGLTLSAGTFTAPIISSTTINVSSTATVGGLTATGTISINGTVSITGNPLFLDSPYFMTKLLPSGSSIDIGASPSERFGTLYCENINNSVNLTVTGNATVGNILRGSSSSDMGGGLTPFRNIYTQNFYVTDGTTLPPYQLNASSTVLLLKFPSILVQGPIDFSSALSTSTSVNIGSGTDRFGTVYCSAIDTSANMTVGGVLTVVGACSLTGGTTANGINPPDPVFAYSLGTTVLPWYNIYARTIDVGTDIYSTAWVEYTVATPGVTPLAFTNFTPNVSSHVYIKKIGKRTFVELSISGATGTASSFSMTLPYNVKNVTGYYLNFACRLFIGSWQIVPGLINASPGSGSITLYLDFTGASFSGSSTLALYGNFEYETA